MPGRPKRAVLLSMATRKVHSGQFRLVCAWEWWGSMALGKFCGWKIAYLPKAAELGGARYGG